MVVRFRWVVGLVLGMAGASGAGGQEIRGMVFDGVTRAPIVGALVAVVDADFREIGNALTDSKGVFVLDAAGGAFLVASRTGYATSAPVDLAEEGAPYQLITLAPRAGDDEEITTLQNAASESTSFLFGRIVDAHNRRGLGDALIELVGRNRSVTSGENGRFNIEDVEPGVLMLRVSHLSFGTREYTLTPEAGLAYQFFVPLAAEAIELEGIQVVARPRPLARRLQEVYQRIESPKGGYVRTEEDFAVRGYPRVGQILESIPSTTLQKRGGLYLFDIRGCDPAFYMDGVRVARSGDTWALSEYLGEPTFGIEVIEVFPGPATLPPEYNDPGTFCAVAIWTRRGG